jgi:hypothetical protein
MAENEATIGRITTQEAGEIIVENSGLGESLGRIAGNWKVKCLLIPTILLVANIPRASQFPEWYTADDLDVSPPSGLVSKDTACFPHVRDGNFHWSMCPPGNCYANVHYDSCEPHSRPIGPKIK